MSYRPLADEIRPQSLDEVVGQRHILGENGLLRRIIESGHIPNLVFYGPSGTGKTTVANIIARRTNRPLHRLNATTASISDIKDIIKDIGTMLAPDGVLLYLDEIQYFNKKQQQSLLEFMENGKITLIASTTENPYFYVYNAVLSRSTVFEFKPIEAADVLPAIDRGIRLMGERLGAEVDCEDGVREHIATACGGDVRKSMNAVELLLSSARREGERLVVTLADAQTVAQRSAMRYDREGDDHYDIASALMKSMRGSDPDAALHYLARLLEAGDMTTAIRRILCSASEDVGMAYPQAALIVKAWTTLSSSACRRPASPWPRRWCCWPPPPSPTRSTRPSPPLRPMCGRARSATTPATSRTSTPTRRGWSGSRATSTPTTFRATGCASSICLTCWRTGTTTATATTRMSRPPGGTGTRSKAPRHKTGARHSRAPVFSGEYGLRAHLDTALGGVFPLFNLSLGEKILQRRGDVQRG